MKSLYLISLLAIFINAGIAQTQTIDSSYKKLTLEDFVGTWSGEVMQTDADSYSLKVHISAPITSESVGEYIAWVEYPELKCSGNWKLNEIKGDRIILSEKLDIRNDCVDNGIVKIIINKDYVEYEWYYPNGKFACSARLNKE
ncbi:MAG TPA: hypothetical protein VK870_10250 [Ignavibacteriaceae bacterium]|nr:hypothetical protein [Ignavibacteriaceae bacterium]